MSICTANVNFFITSACNDPIFWKSSNVVRSTPKWVPLSLGRKWKWNEGTLGVEKHLSRTGRKSCQSPFAWNVFFLCKSILNIISILRSILPSIVNAKTLRGCKEGLLFAAKKIFSPSSPPPPPPPIKIYLLKKKFQPIKKFNIKKK